MNKPKLLARTKLDGRIRWYAELDIGAYKVMGSGHYPTQAYTELRMTLAHRMSGDVPKIPPVYRKHSPWTILRKN